MAPKGSSALPQAALELLILRTVAREPLLAALVHDYRRARTVHRTYLWGGPAMMGLIAGAFALATVPGGEVLQQGLAWVGRVLRPLY